MQAFFLSFIKIINYSNYGSDYAAISQVLTIICLEF